MTPIEEKHQLKNHQHKRYLVRAIESVRKITLQTRILFFYCYEWLQFRLELAIPVVLPRGA